MHDSRERFRRKLRWSSRDSTRIAQRNRNTIIRKGNPTFHMTRMLTEQREPGFQSTINESRSFSCNWLFSCQCFCRVKFSRWTDHCISQGTNTETAVAARLAPFENFTAPYSATVYSVPEIFVGRRHVDLFVNGARRGPFRRAPAIFHWRWWPVSVKIVNPRKYEANNPGKEVSFAKDDGARYSRGISSAPKSDTGESVCFGSSSAGLAVLRNVRFLPLKCARTVHRMYFSFSYIHVVSIHQNSRFQRLLHSESAIIPITSILSGLTHSQLFRIFFQCCVVL